MRLMVLLAVLAVGLWGIGSLYDGQGHAPRAGLLGASQASLPDTPAEGAALPASVRRLVDPAPVTPAPPSRPIVSGEALPIPVSQARVSGGADGVARISVNRANVRLGPSTRSSVIGTLTRGEEVEVLGAEDGWLHIRLQGDGFEGWVSQRLISR